MCSEQYIFLAQMECFFSKRRENQRIVLGARVGTNNKLNLHINLSFLGFEPRPRRWQASALTTVPLWTVHSPLLFLTIVEISARSRRPYGKIALSGTSCPLPPPEKRSDFQAMIFCKLPQGDYVGHFLLGVNYQYVILIYFTLLHGIGFWKKTASPYPPLTQRLFLIKGKMLGQGKGSWVISYNVILIYFTLLYDICMRFWEPVPSPPPTLPMLISHQGQNIRGGEGKVEILPNCTTDLPHVLT